VEASALGQYLFTRICEQGGLSPNEMQLVPLPVDEHLKAWKEYRIDASINFEPELSRLRKVGGQMAWDSRQVPGEVVDCLVIRRSRRSDSRPQVDAFLRAWHAELQLIQDRDPAQIAALAKTMGLSPAETLAAFDGIKLLTPAEAEAHLHSEALAQTANRIQKQMLSAGLIRRIIPLSELLPPGHGASKKPESP
jgi:NitT/TauT family transport system substrate-binding protein